MMQAAVIHAAATQAAVPQATVMQAAVAKAAVVQTVVAQAAVAQAVVVQAAATRPNLCFSDQPLATWSTLSTDEDRLSVAALMHSGEITITQNVFSTHRLFQPPPHVWQWAKSLLTLTPT
jgi:hypothetical protein